MKSMRSRHERCLMLFSTKDAKGSVSPGSRSVCEKTNATQNDSKVWGARLSSWITSRESESRKKGVVEYSRATR